ncbi:hypothetical protein ACN2XU_08425 [Primorskyibacter sp. 2E107]
MVRAIVLTSLLMDLSRALFSALPRGLSRVSGVFGGRSSHAARPVTTRGL